jgi:hypothetical protein
MYHNGNAQSGGPSVRKQGTDLHEYIRTRHRLLSDKLHDSLPIVALPHIRVDGVIARHLGNRANGALINNDKHIQTAAIILMVHLEDLGSTIPTALVYATHQSNPGI